jgi:23S rRNA pseudouridine1911/1915/1917 synthase
MGIMKFEFIIDEENKDKRIDVFLSENVENTSRSHIQKLVDEGNVIVKNKNKLKANYKLKQADVIQLNLPEPEEFKAEPENIPINIIYEDKDIVLVDKDRGIVVHPAPGNYTGTLVNALLYHCKDLSGINGVKRPGIVHRIDKDTSGILVMAKNDKAHMSLAEQFKAHTIKREYIALVEGIMKQDSGIVDAPIARHPKERIKMAIVKTGKRAVTHYEVIERFSKFTLVKCELETGRTHQIRVHLKSLGFPLVGDTVYGFKHSKFKLEGQFLHARKLGFIHPSSGEYVEFISETPVELTEILDKIKKMEKGI